MSTAAEKERKEREDTWVGAYGALVGVTLILGYLNGGADVALTAVFWLLGISVAVFVLALVVVPVVAFHRAAREDGGDPVVAWGVLAIVLALLALLVTGDWLLALGMALGLPLGFWYWKRPVHDVS